MKWTQRRLEGTRKSPGCVRQYLNLLRFHALAARPQKCIFISDIAAECTTESGDRLDCYGNENFSRGCNEIMILLTPYFPPCLNICVCVCVSESRGESQMRVPC